MSLNKLYYIRSLYTKFLSRRNHESLMRRAYCVRYIILNLDTDALCRHVMRK